MVDISKHKMVTSFVYNIQSKHELFRNDNIISNDFQNDVSHHVN